MRVRKLGGGPLVWAGGSLSAGDVGDVPLSVAERYAHKLELLEPLPPPRPIVSDETRISSPPTPAKRPRKRPAKPKPKPRG